MYESGKELEPEEYVSNEDKADKANKSIGTDLYQDLYRLEKMVKKSFTTFKKMAINENIDGMVRLGNLIKSLTATKFEIACVVMGIEDLVKGKTYYKK